MKTTAISLFIVSTLALFCTIAEGNRTMRFEKSPDHEYYVETAKRLRDIEKFAKDSINTMVKKALPYVMEFSEKIKINVSQECMKNSMAMMLGMKKLKPWAYKFFDASGKLPVGMMSGTAAALGHYEQCLDIEVKGTGKKDLGKKLFQGQYCVLEGKALMYLKKPKAIYLLDFPPDVQKIIDSDSIFAKYIKYIYFAHLGGLRLGLCVPSGCSKDDLNGVLNTLLANPNINVTIVTCEVKEEKTVYSTAQILVFSYYAFFIILAIVASGIEHYVSQNNIVVKSRAIQALLVFSFTTNFRKFRAPSQSTDNIGCLNGMKFFGMTWVLLGHSLMSGVNLFTQGITRYEHYLQELPFQAVLNAMFCVDTFFIIGGFLVAYLITKDVIVGKKNFNIILYIVHRLWRIWPTYFILLSTMFIIPLMNSGPGYKEATDLLLDPCYRNWWTNLLFITNYFEATDWCFLHTWYLTIDFQLYVLSLIVILPLIRWPRIGLTVLFSAIIGNILYAFIVTYVNEWPPIMLFSLMDIDETIDLWKYIYYVPWTHIGPYGVGFLTGYIYSMNPNAKMSRRTQVLGWCIAFTCSFSVLYGSRDWYMIPRPPYLAALYAGFCRTAWSVGPSWIIYASATGHGGIINWILSWRLFTHLGRLSFCSYIIHMVPMILFFSGMKTYMQADIYIPIWCFFSLLSVSLVLAFIIHLFIEVPFLRLERIFFEAVRGGKKNSENEKEVPGEEFKTEKNGVILTLAPSIKDNSTKL